MIRSPWLVAGGLGALLLGVMFFHSEVCSIGDKPAGVAEHATPQTAAVTLARPATLRNGNGSFKQAAGGDADEIVHRLLAKRKRLLSDEPKRHDNPQAAMDFFLQQRLPAGSHRLPLETLRAARTQIAQRLERKKAAASRAGRAVEGWTELGPPNIGGRTRAIVIDPVNPNIMYAAGVAGGVWKSTDGGASWSATDDFMANLAVSSLVMDPTNASVLYAGTGEGFFNGDAVRGLGIFKTTDAGATWTQLASTVTGVPFGAFFAVNELVISPADHERVYAATRYGVWKSSDGGNSWSVVLRNPFFLDGPEQSAQMTYGGCLDIAIRTDTAPGPDALLAAFGTFVADGLYRSTDSGATWTRVGTGADLIVENQGRMEIAFAPSDNDMVYICMADNGAILPPGTVVNIFRSTDGGVTWTPRLDLLHNPNNPFLLSNIVFGNGCFGFDYHSQGDYDNVIKVDPVDPNIVWVGGIDLFRSDDGGVNFGLASYWYFSPTDPQYVHADHHALAFHPDYNGATNQTLYSGSDGGLARTDNARAATAPSGCPFGGDPLPDISWVGLNNGYGVTQFYHGDSAKDRDAYAGGTQDNGTLLVDFVPPTTDWHEIVGGDGGYFAFDSTDSRTMYAETQYFPSIEKSTDGGVTFSPVGDGITDFDGLFITPFAMDPSNSQILWTGGTRPWRTMNGAGFWQLAAGSLTGAPISAIAIAPSDSQVVYLGTAFGGIARTDDGLNTQAFPSWQLYDMDNGLSEAWVSSIAVHPTDPQVAYCTFSNFGVDHVMRTENGGVTWQAIDRRDEPTGIPDIPANWIGIRPCDPQQLYVGTDLGVFESMDGGATWEPASEGLANTVVEALDFQSDFTLVAFTHGRGAFRTLLDCPCTPVPNDPDCNMNGNPDLCDIVSSTSSDCNGNEVPDECELEGNDCNGNGTPDDCELDCQSNGVPDDCDLDVGDPDGDGTISTDCDGNAIPDECDPDCNVNGVPDACDLDAGDPDGDGSVSDDCDANGFPDECDAQGGGLLLTADFESGIPAGWATTGIFRVTGACGVPPACNGSQWAYAGNVGSCQYGDDQIGELRSPLIQLGPTDSELSFCMFLDSELDFDFAEIWANETRVFQESGRSTGWEDRTIDLGAFAGQSITLRFRFVSDSSVSGTAGWYVDHIQLISGSPPLRACCSGTGVCDIRLPECCTEPGLTPADSGGVCTSAEGCCLPDGTCDLLDPLCCVAMRGSAKGSGTQCSADEACCLPGGTCEMFDPLCCSGAGGQPLGAESTCTAEEACCRSDGTCALLSPACCMAEDGTPLGAGTECSEPVGCCLPDATCRTLDQLCCEELGGTAQGEGTECGQLQACCLSDGTCQSSDALCCNESGGSPQGIGSSCAEAQACCLPSGSCQLVAPACCSARHGSIRGAGSVCTAHICECNVDADCNNGLYCDGVETCNLSTGCQAGSAVCTDEAKPHCDEADDACVECTTDAHCDDGVSCTVDACNPDTLRCSNVSSDSACDDGDFCNGAETCDIQTGCRSGTPPDCDDGVDCTVDSCDTASAACLHARDDSVCDDGQFCNGAESCSIRDGCIHGTAPNCDDDIDNNLDLCNEANDLCRHGRLVVNGEHAVSAGSRQTYRSFIIYDDGAEEEVTNRVTWRVLSDTLPGVESRACVVANSGTVSCRGDLYGQTSPDNDALIGILLEARLTDETETLVAMHSISVLPNEEDATQPAPTTPDTSARRLCGAFGLVGLMLPLIGLGWFRYQPMAGRRRRPR